MSKFNTGDSVVCRSEHQNGGAWEVALESAGLPYNAVLTVERCTDSGNLYLYGVADDRDGIHWPAANFRLATSQEIHQGRALPAEDHTKEKEAHVEWLREKAVGLELQLAAAHDVATHNEGRTKAIIAERDALADQLEAATHAAKTYAADARAYRTELAVLRQEQRQYSSAISGLGEALAEIDVDHVAKQLEAIGTAMENSDNGADANLAYDAAIVLRAVSRLLDKFGG